MKFATILVTLIAAITSTTLVAGAAVERHETNAERMARGLPPRSPTALSGRSSLVEAAKRHQPSANPQCPSGTLYCCNKVKKSRDNDDRDFCKNNNIQVSDNTGIGRSCTIMRQGDRCRDVSACCTGNSYSRGGMVTGCSKLD